MKWENHVCMHLIKHLFFTLWFSFCTLEPTIISRLQTLSQALEKLLDPGPWAHRAWRINNPVGEILWEVPGLWALIGSFVPTPYSSRLMVTRGGSRGSVSDVVTRVHFLFSPPITVRLGTLFCSLLYPQPRIGSGTSQVLNTSICWMQLISGKWDWMVDH